MGKGYLINLLEDRSMVLTSQKISNANGQIIGDPLLIKPNVFNDERGFFMERNSTIEKV